MRVVELFAGVGGFRVGLEKASNQFNTIWANQWEPGKTKQWAYDCYINHFGEGSCVNDDIAVVKQLVPDHDLLVGGFPCQDYSVASTGAKGINGKKGVLWWEIRDIIENKRPKFILLENVDRLIKSPASQVGRDFTIMLKCLNDLEYIVEWRVINAADYGQAQRRRRVFIFAYSKRSLFASNILLHNDFTSIITKTGFFHDVFHADYDYKYNKPVDFSRKSLVEISNSTSIKYWNSGISIDGMCLSLKFTPKSTSSIPLINIIEQTEVDSSLYLTESKIEKFSILRGSKKIKRKKPNGEDYFYSEGSMSPHDDLSLPARTMLTSEGSVNRSTHIIEDPTTKKLRFLSPLECERINGFPDNWTNTGMPNTTRYFCMGNALVVPLISLMGKKIITLD